jgi:sulfoxide reductase heme-binding subunit YedZ
MNELLWYLSRASGLVGFVLLSGTLILGMLNAGRAATRVMPSFVRARLHRTVSLVMVVAVTVHVVTAVAETYVDIGWRSLLVPLSSSYDRVWVGLGTFAFDLLVVLAATSWLRSRIPQRWWRLVHWTAYAMWPVAAVHAIGTTTSDTTAVYAVTGACLSAVAGVAVWRFTRPSLDGQRRRAAAAMGWR